MNARTFYQIHKWLAVVVAVPTLAWFVSGVVLVIPKPTVTGGHNSAVHRVDSADGAPTFESAATSIPNAITAVRARVGKPLEVGAVRLRRLPSALVYEIVTEHHGTHLVDAVNGRVLSVDEHLVLSIATRMFAGATLGPVTRVSSGTECAGLLPAFRVAISGDTAGTALCVSAITAEVRATNRSIRIMRTIGAWHDFSSLRPVVSGPGVHAMLFGFAVFGTAMSVAGVAILLVQTHRWLTREERP